MTLMETYCTECGKTVRNETDHCPNCGAEDPWDERSAYRFDEEDLPIVISHEIYQDHNELWQSFCSGYFGSASLTGDQIADLPDEFPSLGYCVFDVYYVVTESMDLEGPFLERSEAREAVSGEVSA